MSEWTTVYLGENCRIRTGKKDVNEGSPKGQYPFFTCSRDVSASDEYSFDTEAILIAGNGDVGNLHYYNGKFEAYQRTYVLDNFEINSHYVYQYLLGNILSALEKEKVGTSIPYIKLGHLTNFPIFLPKSTKLQNKIAGILLVIDQAIEQTEALIEKYQQIKAGLMHDLFTRGIGEDGKLRPSREQAPALYQQTPIGWIPQNWSIRPLVELSEICSGVTLGSKITPDQTINVPYLRVANVQDGYIDLSDVKEVLVNKKTFQSLLLQKGDVLMNEGGDFDKLGRGAVWQGEIEPCIHQNHVFRVRTDGQVLRHSFLAYWSQSTYGKKYFVLSSKQSTNLASINSTQLKKFPIAFPSVYEQEEIEKRVNAINEKISSLERAQIKLGHQKAGLMHDLLTGKVQAPINTTEAEHV